MAGYSGTPLARKLGIGPQTSLVIENAPAHLADKIANSAEANPEGGNPGRERDTSSVVVIFATEASELERCFIDAMKSLPPDGAIWCAWPKRASKVPTDITEDRLRDLFLPTGMVDNKVAAIDETWSGLRFVVRKELRQRWNA